MQVVILAGGLGTRISEESHLRPKPMIEIGGKPILWHIMKIYSQYGFNDFIICCGFKGYVIKEYFANYQLHNSDITFDMKNNKTIVHENFSDRWSVTLVDTGELTQTGGRLKRIGKYLKPDQPFLMTYGDGVGDIKIDKLIEFHKAQNRLATLTAVQPPGRFGQLVLDGNKVTNFAEKPKGTDAYISSGFFVLSPKVLDLIDGDQTVWEQQPLAKLAKDNQLSAYTHEGFWQPMDTLREKNYLEDLWKTNKAPWKTWS